MLEAYILNSERPKSVITIFHLIIVDWKKGKKTSKTSEKGWSH